MLSTSTRTTRPPTSSSRASRGSRNAEKTEVSINVYDLLPPGRLASILWIIGGSLLHSGVVIRGREYAYGGHNHRNTTGVYFTQPRLEPPGGTFKCTILQGFTFRTEQEIDTIIKEVSQDFLGTGYNLLSYNCNHFTSALCERVTGKAAPSWLNRAASIGLALPCVVPKEWVTPPDHETADGELLEEDDDLDHEGAAMLESEQKRRRRDQQKNIETGESVAGGKRLYPEGTPPPRIVKLKDTSGREMPTAERAPVPKWT